MELGWFICDAELSHKTKQGNIQLQFMICQNLSQYRK